MYSVIFSILLPCFSCSCPILCISSPCRLVCHACIIIRHRAHHQALLPSLRRICDGPLALCLLPTGLSLSLYLSRHRYCLPGSRHPASTQHYMYWQAATPSQAGSHSMAPLLLCRTAPHLGLQLDCCALPQDVQHLKALVQAYEPSRRAELALTRIDQLLVSPRDFLQHTLSMEGLDTAQGRLLGRLRQRYNEHWYGVPWLQQCCGRGLIHYITLVQCPMVLRLGRTVAVRPFSRCTSTPS